MVEYHSRMERRRAQESGRQKSGASQQKHTKKSGGGGKKHGWFKRIMIILLLAFLFLILAGSITVLAVIKNAPALNSANLRDPISSVIYDKNGKKATNVYSGENRMYTSIDSIPLVVQNAFISTEDVRFYKHFGIDPVRIAGAGVAQFTKGFKSEGASTITQQVVRASFLNQNKTFTRKIQEAYLAIQLEKKYTKKQILEMYLNKIYLGGGPTYGVAAATEKYFGTNIRHVTLEQAAMLAAMTRNPGYYDPIAHPARAKARRDLVLDLMVKNNAITPEQAAKAKAVPMKVMTRKHHPLKDTQVKYAAFVDYVYQTLKKQNIVKSDSEFKTGGLKIYTTLDPAIQKRTEQVLNNKSNFPNVQSNFESGVSVIDTQTGAIRALGGGRNYKTGTMNWAINQQGNPIGSTAKPIMDYGPAIEYLNWPTNEKVLDEPWHYTGGTHVGNWDGSYYGPITMREALYASRNVPAVRTIQNFTTTPAGQDKIKSFIGKLGFSGNRFSYINESYAIGAFSSSPLQMSGAYAAFGNSGIYNEPYAVTKVVFPSGDVVELNHTRRVAMHDYTAYMITDMLKDVVSGKPHATGTLARIPGVPLAGKTGTQNISPDYAREHNISLYDQNHGATDAWFVGYTSRLTASVWTGYENVNSKLKDNGSYLGPNEQKYSQLIFRYIMSNFMPGAPDFRKPNSVISIGGGELAVRNSSAASGYQQRVKEAADKAKKKDQNNTNQQDNSSSSSTPPSTSSDTTSENSSSSGNGQGSTSSGNGNQNSGQGSGSGSTGNGYQNSGQGSGSGSTGNGNRGNGNQSSGNQGVHTTGGSQGGSASRASSTTGGTQGNSTTSKSIQGSGRENSMSHGGTQSSSSR
ncbi:PBP1A family penicillin-binding protein [Sporolactobacillus sp. THM7-4]|nr:PBP1A family penicillin-binding protein [Sporolactobacillus sp. THM7-4]